MSQCIEHQQFVPQSEIPEEMPKGIAIKYYICWPDEAKEITTGSLRRILNNLSSGKWKSIFLTNNDNLEKTSCIQRVEATEYFCLKLGERLPEDWFENIEVYSAEITFTTLEDFGAVISFGESMLPDHVVEFTIDKFTIKSDLLMG